MPEETGMKRRQYAVLQKKLEELESLLRSVAAAMEEKPSPSDYQHELACDEITSRIGFLNYLLAAEMECSADEEPEHLHHIARRLSALEGSFHNWIDLGLPVAADGLDETLSACSCTHSCLNEAEGDRNEERDEDGIPDPDSFVPAAGETDVQVFQQQEIDENEKGAAKKQRRFGGRGCCVIGAVMAVTAAVIMAATNLCTVDENVFLVPT